MEKEKYKLFISYSWDSNEHQKWAKNLADKLEEFDEIHVVFDQYDLDSFEDKNYFMERAVFENDLVLIIVTKHYIEKANNRLGGVGIETKLSTSIHWEESNKGKPSKIIPILREGEVLPNYLKEKIYLDFREGKNFNASFDKLLKHITGNSKVKRPQKKHSINQSSLFRDSIKKDKAIENSIPKKKDIIGEFFKNIANTPKALIKPCIVSLGVSVIIALLSSLSYKMNGVSLNLTLYSLVTIITWNIFALFGSIVWFVSWILLGKGGFFKSISAFFYTTPYLFVGKFIEILSRIERDKELLKGKLNSSTTENMTLAINSNRYAFASEISVFIFYIILYFLLIKLIRSVHGFGFFRSAFAGGWILFFMSMIVTWIQRPIIHALLNTFKISS